MSVIKSPVIERRALSFRQNPDHEMFVFALRAHEVLSLASISRISRTEQEALIGYQRQEVRKHVEDILEYLNQDGALFPNALILAFNESVKFRRSRGPGTEDGLVQAGTLEIPVPGIDDPPPAWIVDGQQRALALSRARNGDFPVPVVGFVAPRVEVQREQFLRVNNTRSLPRALITELLPQTDLALPRWMAARKLPSAIVETLNSSSSSPFYRLIRRPSLANTKDTAERGVVTDTALVEMVRARLTETGGCLFPHRNIATGETDTASALALLVSYWTAVRTVFPDAWGLPPTRSRLMHAAGIKAMGSLMDAMVPRVGANRDTAPEALAIELRRIADACRWTAGSWEGLGGVPWNGIEDTPRDVRLLSNHLVRLYVTLGRT
jgi:DGQHR domain-containing protein